MNETLKVFKTNMFSDIKKLSDEDIIKLFQCIDLNIVQYWIDNNFNFEMKSKHFPDFLSVTKAGHLTGCASLRSPNWSLFSPIDGNILWDQSEYFRLIKLSVFI